MALLFRLKSEQFLSIEGLVLSIVRDITECKRTEEEKQKLEVQLQQIQKEVIILE